MTDKPDLVIEPLGEKHNRAVYAMVVDALNADAEAFYQGFIFMNLSTVCFCR